MTVVVMGIDALDPRLVDSDDHPNLVLESYKPIETIVSSKGTPSTHELWPTIITGLTPAEHGLVLDNGVAWEHPLLNTGSRLADLVLPQSIQTRIGAWLLNTTSQDAFRVPASYYERRGLATLFDGRSAVAIGIPNYVTDTAGEDREHRVRRSMGELFKRDPGSETGHTSADPLKFYEQCLEMGMVRIARVRRALRSRSAELVFGYTSALDLVGHISRNHPELQSRAYDEFDDFVGELRSDLAASDELLLVSDHGLRNGKHTDEAMVASTDGDLVSAVDSVVDVRDAIEQELKRSVHAPEPPRIAGPIDDQSGEIQEHLETLGYL